jgi:uncharacterized protein (DUF1778 family)
MCAAVRGDTTDGPKNFLTDLESVRRYGVLLLRTLERPMGQTAEVKRDRMHLRLDAKTKRKLERAAAYEETSVTDFVLANAVAAAERVIASHEKITLSVKDWEVFYDALINPPEPNEKLKEAARRYRERVGG